MQTHIDDREEKLLINQGVRRRVAYPPKMAGATTVRRLANSMILKGLLCVS
jgi:hypothetical protein